jgi:Tol biopolymer transport system component
MSKASSTEKKPMTPSDTTKIKGVSNPQILPDGTKVAFVVSVVDMAENRSKTDIWVTATKEGKPINVTNDGSSSTPRWSPDGKTLAFLSSEKGKRQLCLMSPDVGNRRVLTTFETSNAYISRTGESLAWAPDGSAIAFLATDKPRSDYSEIVVMERLLTKSLTEFSDFRRTHIFVISPEGGEPRRLTSGEFDEHSICWTADSQEIIFVSDRSGQGDLFVRNDLWAVSPATKAVRQITSTLGAAYTPVCSPKGKKISYLSTTRPDTSNDSVAEDSHLWAVSTDGEGAKDLVKDLDRPCSSIAWTPDGKRILFSASDRGQANLYSVSPDGGEATTVIQGGYSSRGGFSVSVKGRKMAFSGGLRRIPQWVRREAVDRLQRGVRRGVLVQ